MRPSDTITGIVALSLNYVARGEVWKAIRHNWDLLFKRYDEKTERHSTVYSELSRVFLRYGSSSSVSHFFTALHWMTSQKDLEEFKSFFEQPGRKLGAGLLAYRETLETIAQHRKFLDFCADDLRMWLSTHVRKGF